MNVNILFTNETDNKLRYCWLYFFSIWYKK